jgi:hypothetical protein
VAAGNSGRVSLDLLESEVIITDRFVVLNNPKTGSSFVRTVLKKLHGYPTADSSRYERLLHRVGLRGDRGFTELLLPNVNALRNGTRSQHGTYAQIPSAHRAKKIVSVVRDPFARILSNYRFGWWQRFPTVDPDTVARHFPHFPDLSFSEFLRLGDLDAQRRLSDGCREVQIGRQTVRFIEMFFRDPPAIFRRLDEEYLGSDRFLEDLPPIEFLRTERLNRDLHEFLRRHGYAEDRLAFIVEHERVNVTPVLQRGNEWTQDLIDEVLYNERLLFRILRHLGFEYAYPLQDRDSVVT